MIAYKLCRQMKNGDIKPLFINKKQTLLFDTWLPAECHPTKGFKIRPFWHCTSEMNAPHLSKTGRVWVKVEMGEYEEFIRPDNQGGKWFLAKTIKIIEVV